MLKIGINGNIGAGKTTYAKKFEEKGIPVFYIDVVAKGIAATSVPLRSELVDLFGAKAFLANGEYNRQFVRSCIVTDAELKRKLETAMGKYLKIAYDQWLYDNRHGEHGFVLVEAAYFFELGMEDWIDLMIGVCANEDIRVERCMKRDGHTEDEVRAMMALQMNQEEKMARCHFTLNGTYDDGYEFYGLFQALNVMCKLHNQNEKNYRLLIAQAVAYGVGYGESKNEPIDPSTLETPNWEYLWKNGPQAPIPVERKETTKEELMELVNSFFKQYKIV